PLPFRDIHVLVRASVPRRDPNGPWVKVSGAGLPHTPSHIWPAATKPTWYPPGLGEVAKHGVPHSQFQAEFDKITTSGYRPIWIDGYSVNGQAFYNVIFRPANGKDWVAKHGLNGSQYQA